MSSPSTHEVFTLGKWRPKIQRSAELKMNWVDMLEGLGFKETISELRTPYDHKLIKRNRIHSGDYQQVSAWHTDITDREWIITWANRAPTAFREFKAEPFDIVCFHKSVEHRAEWRSTNRLFFRTFVWELPEKPKNLLDNPGFTVRQYKP